MQLLAFSDAVIVGFITGLFSIITAAFGLIGILITRGTRKKIETGNGHSIGEAVAGMETRLHRVESTLDEHVKQDQW